VAVVVVTAQGKQTAELMVAVKAERSKPVEVQTSVQVAAVVAVAILVAVVAVAEILDIMVAPAAVVAQAIQQAVRLQLHQAREWMLRTSVMQTEMVLARAVAAAL
jgi:hypothetical protein